MQYSGATTYQCPCGYSTSNAVDLSKHEVAIHQHISMELIEGGNASICYNCFQQFADAPTFYAHLAHHAEYGECLSLSMLDDGGSEYGDGSDSECASDYSDDQYRSRAVEKMAPPKKMSRTADPRDEIQWDDTAFQTEMTVFRPVTPEMPTFFSTWAYAAEDKYFSLDHITD
jgi:hypothetical protein